MFLETMGCYLADYWARVGTWAVRFSCISESSRCTAQGNVHVILCLGTMILSATTLAVLLVIGGVETNPEPGVETQKIMHVFCSGCDRILKSGTQCDTCGHWFHNSCGNVKAQVADSRKWVCDKCRLKRPRELQEKLQDALQQIDTLTRKNKTLEEQLQLVTAGREASRHKKVQGHPEGDEFLVLGDSIVRSVGTVCSDMKAECFLGIRTEQLQRVIVKSDLGRPDAVIIHVGTNDLRRTGKLDYVMGDVHDLINTAKTKFSTSRLALSSVLRRRAVSWRRIGAVNDRLEWVANTLGVTFADPNSWVDGLHINRRGARQLGQLYSRVCGIGGGRQKMRSE